MLLYTSVVRISTSAYTRFYFSFRYRVKLEVHITRFRVRAYAMPIFILYFRSTLSVTWNAFNAALSQVKIKSFFEINRFVWTPLVTLIKVKCKPSFRILRVKVFYADVHVACYVLIHRFYFSDNWVGREKGFIAWCGPSALEKIGKIFKFFKKYVRF